MAALRAAASTPHARIAPRPLCRLPARVVCRAGKKADDVVVKPQPAPEQQRSALMPIATAAMCASLLLGGALAPQEALAARSGGRMGASSFSARRSQSYAP